jgi:hypothetical protein
MAAKMTKDEIRQRASARYRSKKPGGRAMKGCEIVKGGKCQCHGRFARMARCEK